MSNRKPHERLFDLALFGFVPVVVYTMMIVHWLLDPFYAREKTARGLLPDLSRFPSATSRKLGMIGARGGSAVVQIVILLVQCALLYAGHIAWHEKLSAMYPAGVSHTLAFVAVALTTWWAFWWMDILRIVLLREPTQQALRRRLIRIGLPTCVSCGENLKGVVGGACPTCMAATVA